VIANDGNWETKYQWQRKGIAESFAIITWAIPPDTVSGTYRCVIYLLTRFLNKFVFAGSAILVTRRLSPEEPRKPSRLTPKLLWWLDPIKNKPYEPVPSAHLASPYTEKKCDKKESEKKMEDEMNRLLTVVDLSCYNWNPVRFFVNG